MKSLVVAIEFPIKRRELVDIAKKMAVEFKAKLHIVHSESVDSYIQHIVVEDNLQLTDEIMQQYKENFKKQLNDLQDELSADKIEAECILIEGPSVDLIFGSTHNLLIKKSTIPILIIPPKKSTIPILIIPPHIKE